MHKEKKKRHKDKKKHREKDRAGHGGVHTAGQLPQVILCGTVHLQLLAGNRIDLDFSYRSSTCAGWWAQSAGVNMIFVLQVKEEAKPDVKLRFQPPAKVQPAGLRSPSVKPPDVKADVSEAIKAEGVPGPPHRPPAKPSAPKAMPAASHAPSTATGISDDITGEVGMLAGSSAPSQPSGALSKLAAAHGVNMALQCISTRSRPEFAQATVQIRLFVNC